MYFEEDRWIEVGWIKKTDPYPDRLEFYVAYQLWDEGFDIEDKGSAQAGTSHQYRIYGVDDNWYVYIDGGVPVEVFEDYGSDWPDGNLYGQSESEDSESPPENELTGHFWDLEYRSGTSWAPWDDMGTTADSPYVVTRISDTEFKTYGPPSIITGVTGEVNCDELGGVTVELKKGGVVKDSTTSDGDGDYELTALEKGSYLLEATKQGFREQKEWMPVNELGEEYEFDLIAQTGLIPDAPDMSYVLLCVNRWLFPPGECGLTMSKVLAVVNAWLFPAKGGGGEEETRVDVTVRRYLPASVGPGETFAGWLLFYVPSPYEFSPLGVTDVAPDVPEDWEVTIEEGKSSPAADLWKATGNRAEIAWYGPYSGRYMFAVYHVTVPQGTEPGLYSFGDGWLEYYVDNGDDPFIVEIEGDDVVRGS